MKYFIFTLLLILFFTIPFSHSMAAKNPDIVITAERFEVEEAGKKANATGGVTLTQGPLVITADEVIYQRANKKIEFESKSKRISFRYKKIQGSCGKALYLVSQKKIILMEKPFLDRGEDHIEGEKIEFNVATQRISIVGNSTIRFQEGSLDQLEENP